jgi:hypothetical protein
VLKRTNALFDAIWGEIRRGQAEKLQGRRTTPATSDEELSAFLQETLATSKKISRGTEKLLRRALATCADVETGGLFPGCSPRNTLALAACTIQTTRCRACELLLEANPRLLIDCDAFDDGQPNASCAPGS